MGYDFYLYDNGTIRIKFKSKNKIFISKHITKLNNVLLDEINDYIDIDNLPKYIQAIIRETECIDNVGNTRITMASKQFVKEQVVLCEHKIHLLRGDFNEHKDMYRKIFNLNQNKIIHLAEITKGLSMQLERNKNLIAHLIVDYNCFRSNYYKTMDLIIKGLIAVGVGITLILWMVQLYVK